MRLVKFAKREWETRTFLAKLKSNPEWEREITIATASLETAMVNPERCRLDEQIYFYVSDEYFHLPAIEVCEKHLDEPWELIEEIL